MEFSEMWENFSKGAKEVAGFTAKKTGELTEAAKLKINQKSLEKKLEDCFEDAGMLYYDCVKNGNDHNDEIAEIFAQCDDYGAQIDELKTKIAKLVGKSICPKCGKEMTEKYGFCPYCGTEIPKIEDDASEE